MYWNHKTVEKFTFIRFVILVTSESEFLYVSSPELSRIIVDQGERGDRRKH